MSKYTEAEILEATDGALEQRQHFLAQPANRQQKTISHKYRDVLGLTYYCHGTDPACLTNVGRWGAVCAGCRARATGLDVLDRESERWHTFLRLDPALRAVVNSQLTGSRIIRVELFPEVRLERSATAINKQERNDFWVLARLPTGVGMIVILEVDERAHSARSYTDQGEADKMRRAIAQAVEKGASHIYYIRFNPNLMTGDGSTAEQRGVEIRSALVVSSITRTIAAFATGGLVAPADGSCSVRVQYLWYPQAAESRRVTCARSTVGAYVQQHCHADAVWQYAL